MTITSELRERFEKVKEKGDINTLTKLMGYSSHTCTSNVIKGRHATTIGKASIFMKFIEKREKKLTEFSKNDQN